MAVNDGVLCEATPIGAQESRRYRYVMISSEVRHDLQWPLAYFRKLDIYHLYRSAPWNDMREADFGEKTVRFRLPTDLLWKLGGLKPDIVQGPEPLSLLMLPYLCATLVYLWLHPRVKLVTLSLEPQRLEDKYHPAIVPLYRAILGLWFRRASVVFWLDSGAKRNLLAYGAPPEKLVNLMYGSWGVDLDHFSPHGEKVSLDTPDPVVLYLGRLSHEKGAEYLIEALKLVHDRGTRAHLAVVGDGPERQRLRSLAERLGVEGSITWFGTVKYSDLPPYIRAAQFMVLPSITTKLWVQQLSSAAWHAMSCGLPVIATQTGCLSEFTPPEAGILVPQRDPISLADAIEGLLKDPARLKQMSFNARAYAAERFDAKRNVRIAEQTILEWCK